MKPHSFRISHTRAHKMKPQQHRTVKDSASRPTPSKNSMEQNAAIPNKDTGVNSPCRKLAWSKNNAQSGKKIITPSTRQRALLHSPYTCLCKLVSLLHIRNYPGDKRHQNRPYTYPGIRGTQPMLLQQRLHHCALRQRIQESQLWLTRKITCLGVYTNC